MSKNTKEITDLILKAAQKARLETAAISETAFTGGVKWPVDCIVGPGLEGAIACESKVGYVNGSKGELNYRGYDIFDLCAYSTFEETSYLLLHGSLPTASQLKVFTKKLLDYRFIPETIRLMRGLNIGRMNSMAALRLGTDIMRREYTYVDRKEYKPGSETTISSDEDSIPMETRPLGEEHAIYELKKGEGLGEPPKKIKKFLGAPVGYEPCYQLISGVGMVAAAVSRFCDRKEPIKPDAKLSFAGNLLYMITGKRPDPIEERIMDVSLILHADHGMNASTFATMVVASTLSDIYFAVGSGISALNGSLHGGANEQVLYQLKEIGDPQKAKKWFEKARAKKQKIAGFGHRVYKAYDPRARVLGPLAEYLIRFKGSDEIQSLFKVALALEQEVVATLGAEKKIFPNVDFYSGLVYSCLGVPKELFTPTFAVSRVPGWTARVMEYLEKNRIFRPRAVYVGPFGEKYTPLNKRNKS